MTIGAAGAGEFGSADCLAEKFDSVADLGGREIGDIDHHLIHADEADDGGAEAVNGDLAAVAEVSGVAIAVADAEGRDVACSLGLPGSVVADGFSGFDCAERGDAGEPAKDGDEFAVVEVIGVDAVGVHSDPNEVVAVVGVDGGGGGVSGVDEGLVRDFVECGLEQVRLGFGPDWVAG